MRKITWFTVLATTLMQAGLSSAGEEPKVLYGSYLQTSLPDPIPIPDPPPSVSLPDYNPTATGQGRFWGTAEYLMWWPKSSSAPSVVSGVSPSPTLVNATAPLPTGTGFQGLLTLGNTPGALNLNTASIAAGNSVLGLQSGGRFTLGYWLDPDQHFGIEGGYFFLGVGHDSSASSNGSPALGIPFIDANTGLPTSYTIAQQSTTTLSRQFVNTTPGVFVHLFDTTTTTAATGSAAVRSSGGFQAFDANGIFNVINDRSWHLDLLMGFRYAELDENLEMASTVTRTQNITTVFEPALGLPINGQPVVDNSLVVNNRTDQFNTRNSFYGGQVGARSEFRFDQLSLFVGAQVGLGDMSEVVDVNGFSNNTTLSSITPTKSTLLAGIPLTIPTGAAVVTSKTVTQSVGGLFAQPGNIGSYQRNVFAVVPQADFKVAYRITDRITGTIGYSFVYMSSVVRPGDQIDHVINPGLLASPPVPGATRPSFAFQGTDFWAQGVTFGLSVRY
ncbi:MAG TPA: BBP7 family outer membrane beta-barrel protein [Gemmata sp.]|nr:BBP7 family outer membrane beta-barrel protein [Gemmata sp.]